MLIYVVEDDLSIQKLIQYSLTSRDYEVESFETGKEFFQANSKKPADLVLLDIMLPDIDGIEILKRLKSDWETKDTWVIMITAKTTEYDTISALDLGADDYIKKPFSVMELISRVGAAERRIESDDSSSIIKSGGIVIDDDKRTVTVDGELIDFTYKEYELLKYMMINKGIALSRENLLNQVWGYDYGGETRTVDMHIKFLREKIGDKKDYIKTVRSVGYSFRVKD